MLEVIVPSVDTSVSNGFVLAWGRTDARVAAVGWTAGLERSWDERKGEMMRLARRLVRASMRGGRSDPVRPGRESDL